MQDLEEQALSPAALQQGYRWSAESVGVDEQQELNLSLQTLLAPRVNHDLTFAEVCHS